ncbi:MAG: hypothetical protein JWR69_2550 [Pedosphaera sp.]|nr:hypothetical protein [Pedosphaera sp.]
MKLKRSHTILSVIVALAAAYYGWWFFASGDVFHSPERKVHNRAMLLQLYETVGVGASQPEVLSAYWQHRTDDLRLIADQPTNWAVTMPSELGASDWRLRIEFQEGRVSAVRVRTSDGPQPKDGPKDKQKNAG